LNNEIKDAALETTLGHKNNPNFHHYRSEQRSIYFISPEFLKLNPRKSQNFGSHFASELPTKK